MELTPTLPWTLSFCGGIGVTGATSVRASAAGAARCGPVRFHGDVRGDRLRLVPPEDGYELDV